MNQTFPSLSSSFNPAQEKKCVNIKETENKKKKNKIKCVSLILLSLQEEK